MIGYFSRLLPVALKARFRASSSLVSRLPQRVSLRQIDLNRHMNQAQYPMVMELGRTDLLLGNDSWASWQAQGLNPVVAEQHLRYRRELKPWQKYVIDSRLVGVDGRFLVLEHYLLVGSAVHASGTVKLLVVGENGVLDADSVEQMGRPWCADPLVVENWQVVS
ncbi:MAG: acyl-CoA thioesterase FadM [Myxococcota bacterium]|jgi:acyl-CoA thioesterase FadM